MDFDAKEVYERLTALESSQKSLHKRVDHIEELVESVQRMTVEIQHLREDFNHMSDSVDELNQRPAKRWDSVIAAVIGAFAGGGVTMLLTKLIGG